MHHQPIPDPVYMLKPDEERESILVNRTLEILDQDDGAFLVLVTDRDYQYDPGGQKQDVVFRETYASAEAAKSELEKQISLSLADGLIHNKLQHGLY
jgi:hypothetical protein